MNLTDKQKQAIQSLQADNDWRWREFLSVLEAVEKEQTSIAMASPNTVDIYRAQGGAREARQVLDLVYKSNEWRLQ